MTGSSTFPRVQAIPGIGRASLCVDGVEPAGYEFAQGGTRPFIFPLIGPSGACLTRLGHPNPIGHEHHKSIWFGHESVAGMNFWEDQPSRDVRIRHRCVRLYHDGHDWGGLVADLDWWAQGRSHLHHELILVMEPARDGGFALDLQSRLESSGGEPVALGKTNFGFLGVRVAKTMAEQFGTGRVTNAQGSVGEPAVMGQPSNWVDYSGPSTPGKIEGLCFMDHPSNPGHPVRWHVRADGWMGASLSARIRVWSRARPSLALALSIAGARRPAQPPRSGAGLAGFWGHAALFDHSASSRQPGSAVARRIRGGVSGFSRFLDDGTLFSARTPALASASATPFLGWHWLCQCAPAASPTQPLAMPVRASGEPTEPLAAASACQRPAPHSHWRSQCHPRNVRSGKGALRGAPWVALAMPVRAAASPPSHSPRRVPPRSRKGIEGYFCPRLDAAAASICSTVMPSRGLYFSVPLPIAVLFASGPSAAARSFANCRF